MNPVVMTLPGWLATDPSSGWSYFQVDNLGGGGGITPPIDCSVTNFTNAVSTPCNNVTDESLVAWADYDAGSGSYNIWYKRTPYGGPFGYSYKPATFGPEATQLEALKVTPNPATNTLNLKASGHYQVSNMLGQVVQTGDLYIGKHTIDVSQLPSGNYLITFTKQGEKPITSKFSKL